jgi:hypothetical protein
MQELAMNPHLVYRRLANGETLMQFAVPNKFNRYSHTAHIYGNSRGVLCAGIWAGQERWRAIETKFPPLGYSVCKNCLKGFPRLNDKYEKWKQEQYEPT